MVLYSSCWHMNHTVHTKYHETCTKEYIFVAECYNLCIYMYVHTQTSAVGVHVQTDAKRSTHIVCFKDCYMLEKCTYITVARSIS